LNGCSVQQSSHFDRRTEAGELNQEYAVGWFTLALINAGLAQGKNRSGFGWWLLSVFLGPIATFILVAFCDKQPGP
jgi:hypothetical protein